MKNHSHTAPPLWAGLTAICLFFACMDAHAQTCLLPDTCDVTSNDPHFWNADHWWDKIHNSHDRCEMPVDLQVRMDNVCPGFGLQIRYTLLLDLDQDGATETAVHSGQYQQTNTVWFGNAQQVNYQGGTPRSFDSRPVIDPALDRYRFALQVSQTNGGVTAALRFNTLRDTNTYVLPQIPHGKHRMLWYLRDGCGQEKTCEYTFEVRDCQKPTVKCKPQMTINYSHRYNRLWASDFLEDVFDNCTPSNQIILGVTHNESIPKQFPRDSSNKQPITSISNTCSNLGINLIHLWAEDKSGNASFCTTLLMVNDANWECVTPDVIAGEIKTVTQKPLVDVLVNLSGTHPAYPPITANISTDQFGKYYFKGLTALGGNYTICPSFNKNPLNGVTTIDLALISKHILGLDTLDSPYQKMAADANNSGTITSFDVVELRKLILGLHDSLPNSDAWRFVAKSYVFPVLPKLVPPCLTIIDKSASGSNYNFIGVKIGDVNNTATPDPIGGTPEDRNLPKTIFPITNRALLPGDVFKVHFHEKNALLAQQFTLHFPHLELLEILPSIEGMDEGHFAHFPQQHQLTHSWNSEQASGDRSRFTLRFRALAAGQLSELLALTDTPTPALAYDAAGNPFKPTLQFYERSNETTVEGLVLLQNQPNPFSHTTTIRFYLPQDDQVRLTVFDEAGKILLQRDITGTKGFNQASIGPEIQLSSGILYYKMASSTGEATQKMIRQ